MNCTHGFSTRYEGLITPPPSMASWKTLTSDGIAVNTQSTVLSICDKVWCARLTQPSNQQVLRWRDFWDGVFAGNVEITRSWRIGRRIRGFLILVDFWPAMYYTTILRSRESRNCHERCRHRNAIWLSVLKESLNRVGRTGTVSILPVLVAYLPSVYWHEWLAACKTAWAAPVLAAGLAFALNSFVSVRGYGRSWILNGVPGVRIFSAALLPSKIHHPAHETHTHRPCFGARGRLHCTHSSSELS